MVIYLYSEVYPEMMEDNDDELDAMLDSRKTHLTEINRDVQFCTIKFIAEQ